MRQEWFVTHILVDNMSGKYASYMDWGADWAPTACFVKALQNKRSVWCKAAASALGGMDLLDHTLSNEESVKELLAQLNSEERGVSETGKGKTCLLPRLPVEFICRYRKHILTPFDSVVVRAVEASLGKISASKHIALDCI